MRTKTLLAAALLALAALAPRPAAAVDLALVLLTDVSGSMGDDDFAMVKAGYKAAFADPEVMAAVRANGGGIAVAYVEFSGEGETKVVKGWDLLTDEASTRAFGAAVADAPRSFRGNTALAASLREATRLLEAGDFGSARRIIDIASDHPTDGGRSAPVRDAAVAAGITINALPIVDGRIVGTYDGHMSYSAWQPGQGGIMAFYRRDVIGGAGSFALAAHDYSAFGEALKRKLLLEIAGRREHRHVPLQLAAE